MLPDADVDTAATMIATAKFRNAGQTCVAPNRIIVASNLYDDFVRQFVAIVEKIVVGSWQSEATMGPVKSSDIVAMVRRHLNDAACRGARVIGGESCTPAGTSSKNFMRPAVVLGWTPDMLLAHEETFGPIAPIRSCASASDMVPLANESNYGLAAYVFGSDINLVTKIVNGLEYGVIGVNQLNSAFANAPIGGWNDSGSGVESGQEGTDQYLRPKPVAMDCR